MGKIYLLLFLILILEIHLHATEIAPSVITYSLSGGVMGARDSVVLKENGFMRYHGSLFSRAECCHQDTIKKSLVHHLFEVVVKSGFLNLNDKYGPSYGCSDGMVTTITYRKDSTIKAVTIKECTAEKDKPGAFKILENEIGDIMKSALGNIECGTLYPNAYKFLKKWPLSSCFSLTGVFEAESVKIVNNNVRTNKVITVEAPGCVVEMFKEEEKKLSDYYENGYIYDLNSDYFHKNLHPIQNDKFILQILRSRIKPATVPLVLGIYLSNIPDEGLYLEGNKLLKVKEVLKSNEYFVNNLTNNTDTLFVPIIVLGNCSKNMPPRRGGFFKSN